MNSVERVKSICKKRRIPISRLERDLGFSNGYVGQLRKGDFPAERLLLIAGYLGVDYEFLLTGEQKEKPAIPKNGGLSEALVQKLIQLTPEEELQVSAFVQGLLAAHKEPPADSD